MPFWIIVDRLLISLNNYGRLLIVDIYFIFFMNFMFGRLVWFFFRRLKFLTFEWFYHICLRLLIEHDYSPRFRYHFYIIGFVQLVGWTIAFTFGRENWFFSLDQDWWGKENLWWVKIIDWFPFWWKVSWKILRWDFWCFRENLWRNFHRPKRADGLRCESTEL